MADPYLGEVRVFACNFAPVGWASCNGQILPLSQYTALFSLLGTYYGGNGTSNFALPNLQGNIPVCQGTGNGLSPYNVGEIGGTQFVKLLLPQMASHIHNLMTDPADEPANSPSPVNNALSTARTPATAIYTSATTPLAQMNANMIPLIGGGQQHNNMMPYLVLNFCIAMTGIFPSRP